MNYLRRRFSSSDIQKDLEDEEQHSYSNAASNFFGFGANKKGMPGTITLENFKLNFFMNFLLNIYYETV